MTTDQLSQFEKKMIIRNIEPADFDKIIELQLICFPNMDPWKMKSIGKSCADFPGRPNMRGVRWGDYRLLLQLNCQF